MTQAIKVRTRFDQSKMRSVAEAGTYDARKSAAAYVRGIARRMVHKRGKRGSAPVGKPPRTYKGRLRESIIFDVPKHGLVSLIGPSYYVIAKTQTYHEFGKMQVKTAKRREYEIGKVGPMRKAGDRKAVWRKIRSEEQLARAKRLDMEIFPTLKTFAAKYPERPLMLPALRKALPRLPDFYRNSIKGR